MTLNTFIIDDEVHALNILQDYVIRTPGLLLAGMTTNPLEALTFLGEQSGTVDLIFTDIDMPELSGLQLAGMLNSRQKLIFTTSFREYGPEAYTLSAQDYLLKPISYERFLQSVQKARQAFTLQPSATLADRAFFVKTGNKGTLQKIRPEEIIYIEAALNYMHIRTTSSTVITYASIQEILERLPQEHFLRVHKSFIINTRRITALENGHVKMDDRSAIPLGRAFRNNFFTSIPELRHLS